MTFDTSTPPSAAPEPAVKPRRTAMLLAILAHVPIVLTLVITAILQFIARSNLASSDSDLATIGALGTASTVIQLVLIVVAVVLSIIALRFSGASLRARAVSIFALGASVYWLISAVLNLVVSLLPV